LLVDFTLLGGRIVSSVESLAETFQQWLCRPAKHGNMRKGESPNEKNLQRACSKETQIADRKFARKSQRNKFAFKCVGDLHQAHVMFMTNLAGILPGKFIENILCSPETQLQAATISKPNSANRISSACHISRDL